MRCREVSPRQAALVILEAWFGGERTQSTASLLPLTDFQHDAVSRLDRIFEQRRGALLADAVGLGKTFVALAIIERALRRDESVALVIPAALRRHWLHHLKRLPANQRSAVTIITHTALSFGRASSTDFALVVVDEAHAFRNPRTRRYASLLQTTRSARVLLLSATPVNNRLEDLYHQIALFITDYDFANVGVGSLRIAFKRAGTDPRAQQSVQRVLEAVMVRRSREHVRSPQHGLAFPTRAPPNAIRYDLVAAYGPAWSTVYNTLEQLSFAAFSNSGVPTAIELMRLQLLKRLESSIAAFTSSVRRQLQINRLLLGSLGAERWIKPASLRSLIVGDGMDAQLTLDALLTETVPRGCNTAELHAAASSDVRLLQECLRALDGADAVADPKLAALQSLVARRTGIIVFTQYRDTAIYLWRNLLYHTRVGLVHGSEARLGMQRAARATVIECFAPRANGARLPHQRVRLDVLVATDVLSEGLNLQDASNVISYDLPWNPVTLMQRIGRVDRLGSLHEMVNVYNFLPDRGLDALLHLLERIETKLHVIDRSVGSEAVLHAASTGTLAPHRDARTRMTEPLSQVAQLESLRAVWREAGGTSRVRDCVIASVQYEHEGWLIAVRSNARLRTLIVQPKCVRDDTAATTRILEAALSATAHYEACNQQPPIARVCEWLNAEIASQQLERLPACASAQTAAIRLLLARVSAEQPTGQLLGRAARLLRRLEKALPSARLSGLQSELIACENTDLLQTIIALEPVCASARARKGKRTRAFRMVAIIRLLAPGRSG